MQNCQPKIKLKEGNSLASGLVLHTIAKIIFLLTGYAMHMYLGKTLSAAQYGIIGVIISINNINYNFLSQGARQAASRALAERHYNEQDIIKKSFMIQFVAMMLLFLATILFAEFYSSVLNVPGMSRYIRMTALVIPAMAGYFLTLGVLNGYKLFIAEACIMILYSLMRLSVIPFVGYVFEDSTQGTIAGFFASAVAALIVGTTIATRLYKRADKDKPRISHSRYVGYVTGFLTFFLCIAVMLSLDMFFINAMLDTQDLVGYYTGATNFAKITYFLLSAVYIVALPIITQKYSADDFQGCSQTINQFFKVIALFILPIPCIVAPLAGNLMASFYTPEYRAAAIPTAILLFSQFFIGFMVVLNIFLCAASGRKFSAIVAVYTLALDAVLCFVMIPRYSITGAATSTLIAGVFGCAVTVVKLRQVYKNLWDRTLSILIVSCMAWMTALAIVARYLTTDSFILSLAQCAVAYVLFLLIVWSLRIASPIKIILELKSQTSATDLP